MFALNNREEKILLFVVWNSSGKVQFLQGCRSNICLMLRSSAENSGTLSIFC